MKKAKKKKKLLLFLALSCILTVSIFAYKDLSYRAVRRAVKHEDAVGFAKKPNWFIITPIEISGGTQFVFDYGQYKDQAVHIIDNASYFKLSNVFLNHKANKFIVRSTNFEEGNFGDEMTHARYRITIDKWSIVAPIKRYYTYTKHERLFYPKDCIDEYDVTHGDYRMLD